MVGDEEAPTRTGSATDRQRGGPLAPFPKLVKVMLSPLCVRVDQPACTKTTALPLATLSAHVSQLRMCKSIGPNADIQLRA